MRQAPGTRVRAMMVRLLLACVLALPACSVMVGNDDASSRSRPSRPESTLATVLPEDGDAAPLCTWAARAGAATAAGGRLVLRAGEVTLTTEAAATSASVTVESLAEGTSAWLSRSCDGKVVVAQADAAPAVLSFAGRTLPGCTGEVVVALGISGAAGEAVFRDFALAGVCVDPFTTPRSF